MKPAFSVLQYIVIATPMLTAQITGTITGTIHDPQGAVVPRASVTATHIATAAVRSITSDSVGSAFDFLRDCRHQPRDCNTI